MCARVRAGARICVRVCACACFKGYIWVSLWGLLNRLEILKITNLFVHVLGQYQIDNNLFQYTDNSLIYALLVSGDAHHTKTMNTCTCENYSDLQALYNQQMLNVAIPPMPCHVMEAHNGDPKKVNLFLAKNH